jgi:hypothetical protein
MKEKKDLELVCLKMYSYNPYTGKFGGFSILEGIYRSVFLLSTGDIF